MARVSKNRSVKKTVYVFWEGESEEAYSRYLKNAFDNRAVIRCHRESGTFVTAKSCYRNDKKFKSDLEEYDELWFFFDTEIEKRNQWDENMKCLKDIIASRTRRNPIKIRLLMTTGCIEYWFLLHYRKTAPQIVTAADKERVLDEVRKEQPNYKKGDYPSTSAIAEKYMTAIENGRWTLERLKDEGLPESEEQRNRWLYKGTHTFTTVHEALEWLLSSN